MSTSPTTTTTLPGLAGLPTAPASGSSTNPTSASAEDQLKVSGVGNVLGLNWGPVTVAIAVSGLEQLAAAAHAGGGKSPAAKAAASELASIQQDLYTAGFYGRYFKPTLGTLRPQDLAAFKAAAVGAASSGQDFGSFLSTSSTSAQANGTTGGGTHIIPAQRVEQKVWTPQDIQAAIEAATTATGENLSQKLIGHNATPVQLQAIADQLNAASGQQAAADQAAMLAQQQTDIASSQAVFGTNANQVSPLGNTTPGGTVSGQQVAQQVASLGGSQTQQQIAAALVSGVESNGDPTELAGGVGPAAGLFQFEPGTWQTAIKGTNLPQKVTDATWQQQVQAFVNYTNKNGFGAWGPDLVANSGNPNDPSNPNYGYSGGIQPGSKVANALAGLNLNTTAGAPSTSNAVFSPVSSGLKKGRTDQGVDYSGKGDVFAVGAGTILSVTSKGWPGQGAFIALKLDHPVDPQHSVVYYAEDITPNVKVGQHVAGGANLGNATGGSTGIEIGWMNPNSIGQPLAQTTGGYTEGQATSAGQNFDSYINGSTVSGTATGGTHGTTTDVYQTPVIMPVPATLDPTAAATNYFENAQAPEYQTNNLLKVFQTISANIGGQSNLNVPVHNAPISAP